MSRITHALSVATIAAIALSACAASSESADPTDTSAAPSSASPPAAPSASPSPTAEGIDTSDWLTYTTVDGAMSYRYPADWRLESSTESIEGSDGEYDTSSLTAPNGQTLLHSFDFVDIGGYCEASSTGTLLHEEPAQVTDLDGDPAVIATIAFDGDPMIFGTGITSSHDLGDGQFGCPFYFVFSTRAEPTSMGTHFQVSNDDPLWNIDSIDDARAYMETDEYATILEILRSVQTP